MHGSPTSCQEKITQLNKINKNRNLFEHKTKIRTYFTRLEENWEKKIF